MKRATKAEAEVFEKLLLKHNERVVGFSKANRDYDEVVSRCEIRLPAIIQETFLHSEYGPELQYELAKNPSELNRICGLPEVRAVMEMGKLEGKIEARSQLN